ncbi:MAG: phosphatase PAP2 family protein [Spirochaetaceae bacterium]|jgi:membrane-associated phospholipid phosphatase|nr:phosphatase PAP2 family protein [Spirochaetaceae bacterium]
MKKLVIVSSVVTVILLVLATFFDLQIDEYIYNPKSSFAKIFATLGMLPQNALLFLAPAMAFSAMFEKRREVKTPVWILIIAALLLVTIVDFRDTAIFLQDASKLPYSAVIPIICFVIFALFLAALPFAKKKPNELLITALIGLAAFTVGYFILQTLKTYWGRQRFFTMNDSAEQFTKWYLPQEKSVSDNFKSFPSGHSFNAMCAVWFALWPLFIDGLKKYTKLIFTLALLFGFATMASRMIYGRHFLSDVTVGAAIALASFALATMFFSHARQRPPAGLHARLCQKSRQTIGDRVYSRERRRQAWNS